MAKVKMFADDTVIYIASNKISNLYENMQKEINALQIWCNQNKLTINVDKTKYMLFFNNIKEDDETKLWSKAVNAL